MFKNRSFNVKMVKDDPALDSECNQAHLDASEINTILTHQVKQVAIAVGGVMVAKTLSEIAIHAAKTYIK